MRKDEKGFTLIELVFLIIILGIISVVISISIGDINSTKLNSAARRLASDIRYAQQLSLTKQVRHGVIFTANSYTVFENDNTADPARNPQGGADFVISFTTGEFAGIAISTSLPGSVVKFESNGRPLDGTNAALTGATNQVTLTYSGSPKSLTITPETGKLSY